MEDGEEGGRGGRSGGWHWMPVLVSVVLVSCRRGRVIESIFVLTKSHARLKVHSHVVIDHLEASQERKILSECRERKRDRERGRGAVKGVACTAHLHFMFAKLQQK